MAVTQVIKWKCHDGTEWDTEDEALTREAYLMRYDELDEVLGCVVDRHTDKDEVIQALLDNFIFTKKD